MLELPVSLEQSKNKAPKWLIPSFILGGALSFFWGASSHGMEVSFSMPSVEMVVVFVIILAIVFTAFIIIPTAQLEINDEGIFYKKGDKQIGGSWSEIEHIAIRRPSTTRLFFIVNGEKSPPISLTTFYVKGGRHVDGTVVDDVLRLIKTNSGRDIIVDDYTFHKGYKGKLRWFGLGLLLIIGITSTWFVTSNISNQPLSEWVPFIIVMIALVGLSLKEIFFD